MTAMLIPTATHSLVEDLITHSMECANCSRTARKNPHRFDGDEVERWLHDQWEFFKTAGFFCQ